jgi:TolB protein
VAFGPRFASPAALPIQPAASRTLDLYGEIDATTRGAGGQLDGSINLEQVSFATEGACIDPDVDRAGNVLVFASTMHRRTSDIYLKSVTGKTITQITSDPGDDVMPAFSPDGTRIAFASNRAGNWDIFLTDVNGGPPTQITTETDHEMHPTWSPDGRTLAYCRFGAQSARWEIWITEIASPGVRRFVEYGVFPEWCPDIARNKIAFQRAKQRGSRDYSVWTIDMANGQASQPTEIVSAANAALINPSWSPDGSRIVFVAVVDPQAEDARPRQSDVWVVNVDGSNRMNLTNGRFANFQPVWASDGSVYFVSDRSGVDNVWAVKAARGGAMEKPQPSGVANADNESSSGPQH